MWAIQSFLAPGGFYPFFSNYHQSHLFSFLSWFLCNFTCFPQSTVPLSVPAHLFVFLKYASYFETADRTTYTPPNTPTLLHTHTHRRWPCGGQTQFKVKLSAAAGEMFPSNISSEIDPWATRCSSGVCDCADSQLRVGTAIQTWGTHTYKLHDIYIIPLCFRASEPIPARFWSFLRGDGAANWHSEGHRVRLLLRRPAHLLRHAAEKSTHMQPTCLTPPSNSLAISARRTNLGDRTRKQSLAVLVFQSFRKATVLLCRDVYWLHWWHSNCSVRKKKKKRPEINQHMAPLSSPIAHNHTHTRHSTQLLMCLSISACVCVCVCVYYSRLCQL